MQTPEFVGIGEIMTMLKVSKSRVHQLVDHPDFPSHYLRLQMGRLWVAQHVIDWALARGRSVARPTYTPEPESSFRIPLALVPGTEKLAPGTERSGLSGSGLGVSPGTPLPVLPVVPVATISSGEEQSSEEQVEKTQSPTLATLAKSTVGPNPPESETRPQRSAQELNKIALAEDFTDLERIYEAAKKDETLPESDMKLVGFATMVISTLGHVPSYRRTKESMIRAWDEVRRAYEPTPRELVALAQHIVSAAQTPYTPGAVKKFSDFEIAKIRRTAATQKARPTGWHRWQGAHGSEDEAIANLTPEQKRLYGVQE